jgi:L-lactate dehydrogenase complex protein LldG
MSARERILQRLRNARAGMWLPLPGRSLEPMHSPAPSSDECLARFELEAAALGIDCYIESTDQGVRERLANVLEDATVASWAPDELPYDAARTFRAVVPAAEAAVGVTGCDAAIAETGSLVTWSAPGRSRTISLLPPTHVALVRREQLCFSMADVFARDCQRFADAASCTIITGPSRTADIELTLTLGIHGPARVIVIVGP